MRTAGTTLWFLDPDAACAAVQVGCPTNITGLDSTIDQLETTCLDALARTYESGLATPGTATFTINFEPSDASHRRLLALKKAGTTVKWAIGFPESQDEPSGALGTDDECDWTLPTTRSWVTFEGFVNSFPLDIPVGGLFTVNVGVQISGDPDIVEATT